MLIVGLEGKQLAAHERARLLAPEVSGAILFTRNYENRDQLARLVASIRELRGDGFVLSVDHEGGPVQRFRDGFTRLPPLACIGALYRRDRAAGVAMAEQHAIVMASEVRACDIDISFAPVVDLARGNRVIAERAFDPDPQVVAELGAAYVRGMRLAGMAATIKHFPGHGSVPEDTHLEAAVDPRPLDAIRANDLVPFAEGFAAGAEAAMVAHVTYPAVDPLAAGYSKTWIDGVLRGEMGYRGVVFSDDVGMAAAASASASQRISMPAATWCWYAIPRWWTRRSNPCVVARRVRRKKPRRCAAWWRPVGKRCRPTRNTRVMSRRWRPWPHRKRPAHECHRTSVGGGVAARRTSA